MFTVSGRQCDETLLQQVTQAAQNYELFLSNSKDEGTGVQVGAGEETEVEKRGKFVQL